MRDLRQRRQALSPWQADPAVEAAGGDGDAVTRAVESHVELVPAEVGAQAQLEGFGQALGVDALAGFGEWAPVGEVFIRVKGARCI